MKLEIRLEIKFLKKKIHFPNWELFATDNNNKKKIENISLSNSETQWSDEIFSSGNP